MSLYLWEAHLAPLIVMFITKPTVVDLGRGLRVTAGEAFVSRDVSGIRVIEAANTYFRGSSCALMLLPSSEVAEQDYLWGTSA